MKKCPCYGQRICFTSDFHEYSCINLVLFGQDIIPHEIAGAQVLETVPSKLGGNG